MLNSRLLALGAAIIGLGAPAYAEVDYSVLGVSLGMSVDEARRAASDAGLDHRERRDTYFYNMVKFTYEVGGADVELMIEDVIGKHDYANVHQEPQPDTPTSLEFYHFLGAAPAPSIYALRIKRGLGEGIAKQDLASWIHEKAGGQGSDCVYDRVDFDEWRVTTHRFLFDRSGNVVAYEEPCETLELPLEPGWGVEEALKVRELGATHAMDFYSSWSEDAPDVITSISISMTDLDAVAEGVEGKKRELSEATSPLSALSDM